MNKKVIITIIAIVLIIVLAVIVGKNISQQDSTSTNANPTEDATANPTPSGDLSTPDVEETSTPETTASPMETHSPEPVVNTTTYSMEQKKEYAKSIAKKTWEKLGVNTKVYYSFDDNITSDGKYIVVVREEATTKELVRYEIDISTGNCKVVY